MQLRIALDWTPNINHIGLFVANQLGFFQNKGLTVSIQNPLDDGYHTTPGKKLANDQADFAIAPFETVISLNNKLQPVDAIAVYAILQQDLSSIATLSSAQITRPADLDNKIYASYNARYEDKIVQQLIRNDGGSANLQFIYPEKLGIWNTLLQHTADATWIFDNWEGVAAEKQQIALTKFSMARYQIPYCYSPVMLALKSKLEASSEAYKNFITAIQQGYEFAVSYAAEALEILAPHLTVYDQQHIDLAKSLQISAPAFGVQHQFGHMEASRVQAFLTWLVANELEHPRILEQVLFTNQLLD